MILTEEIRSGSFIVSDDTKTAIEARILKYKENITKLTIMGPTSEPLVLSCLNSILKKQFNFWSQLVFVMFSGVEITNSIGNKILKFARFHNNIREFNFFGIKYNSPTFCRHFIAKIYLNAKFKPIIGVDIGELPEKTLFEQQVLYFLLGEILLVANSLWAQVHSGLDDIIYKRLSTVLERKNAPSNANIYTGRSHRSSKSNKFLNRLYTE